MMTSQLCQYFNHEYIELVTEILTANEPVSVILLHHEHTEREGHKRNQQCSYLKKAARSLKFALPVAVVNTARNTNLFFNSLISEEAT